MWADDVAACVAAVLERDASDAHEAFDIAGPDTVTHREAVALALRAAGRPRRLVALPSGLLLRALWV